MHAYAAASAKQYLAMEWRCRNSRALTSTNNAVESLNPHHHHLTSSVLLPNYPPTLHRRRAGVHHRSILRESLLSSWPRGDDWMVRRITVFFFCYSLHHVVSIRIAVVDLCKYLHKLMLLPLLWRSCNPIEDYIGFINFRLHCDFEVVVDDDGEEAPN